MGQPAAQIGKETAENGLRVRKKARRRQVILREAGKLFALNGIEATTMATIADAAGVSTPTVFNYFGSKDNLLSSLIFEGAETTRRRWQGMRYDTEASFLDIVTEFLEDVTEKTIQIAGKRVWRYSEAANIRRPNSDFEQRFVTLDAEIVRELSRVFKSFDLVLRNGQPPDAMFLAQMFFDRWTSHYLDFIKNDAMSLATHRDRLRADFAMMISLLFENSGATALPPSVD